MILIICTDAKTKQTSSEDNMHGSAVVQVVEELMPSLPKRY